MATARPTTSRTRIGRPSSTSAVTPKAGTIDSTPPTSAPSIGSPSTTTTAAIRPIATRVPRGPVRSTISAASTIVAEPKRAKARLPSPVNRPATATE